MVDKEFWGKETYEHSTVFLVMVPCNTRSDDIFVIQRVVSEIQNPGSKLGYEATLIHMYIRKETHMASFLGVVSQARFSLTGARRLQI
jgi:hypothetical protein